MWIAWERRGIHTGICFGNIKEGDRLEDLDEDGRMAFKWKLKKQDERERERYLGFSGFTECGEFHNCLKNF